MHSPYKVAKLLFARNIRVSNPLEAAFLDAAWNAVGEAGDIAHKNFGKSQAELGLELKDDETVLMRTDKDIQTQLISCFQESLGGKMPRLSFMAEERRRAPIILDPENVIFVNPLEGTKNYSSGNPNSAIAVAWAKSVHSSLCVKATVTLQPELYLYTLSCGGGTFRIDLKRQSVRKFDLKKVSPSHVIGVCGDIKNEQDRSTIAEMLRLLGKDGYEARMTGSCVLTNAAVATGQFDGSIIYSGRKPAAFAWDTASAHQITQANGVVSTMFGEKDALNKDPNSLIAARNHEVHAMLLRVVESARTLTEAHEIPDRRLAKSYLDRAPQKQLPS